MIPICTLGVEFHPTVTPDPMCFLVFDEQHKPVAVLKYEEVKRAMDLFQEMKSRHNGDQEKP